MYIKQLQMNGFKSFADKTRLEFTPGINSLVGPNGCGKSNVIDAVRWVLGEQKYTLLRSKNMDEVIFAGTSKRKPAGLAQASLVFDNSEGFFPLDAPEIMLTRRAFRDGGGQYLVNNKAVKLRDVHELIADTGIGSGALFILSQQEIDRVLSSDSQERRSILEETAGINKYQLRKKETLRRLKETRQNISRLNDILQEVGRQVDLSKKQLRKLNRYKKLKEKLSRLEIMVLNLDLAEIERQKAELSTILENLGKQKQDTIDEAEKISHRMDHLASEKKRCEVELEAMREKYSRANLEEEKLRGEVDLTREKIRQAKSTLEEYRENLARINERIAQTEDRQDRAQGKLSRIEKLYRDKKAEYEQVNRLYEKLEEDLKGVQLKVEQSRSKLRELNEDLRVLRVQKEHTVNSQKSSAREIEKIEYQISKERSEIDGNLAQIRLKKSDTEKLEKLRQEKREKLKLLQAERNSIQTELSAAVEKREELKREIRNAQSELSLIIREEQEMRGFSGAFKELLKRKDNLPPLTPVHKVIGVKEELESAVEVVLGRDFQAIITRTREDANQCIDILKKQKLGRLTFYPLDMDRVQLRVPNISLDLEGIVGWAKDLIETDEKYRRIIDLICGKTLIVQDLNTAYEFYRHQKQAGGFIPRMVTLSGEVLEFTGAVTGGKYRVDRTGIFSRSRRQKKLEENISENKRLLEEEKKRAKELKQEALKAEKATTEITGQLEEVEQEIRKASGRVEILKTMVEKGKSRLEDLKNYLSEILKKIRSGENNVGDIDRRISALEKEIKIRQEQLKEYVSENEAQLEKLESLKEQRTRLKSSVDKIENDIRQVKQEIENNREYLEEKRKDQARVEQGVSQKEDEIENLEGSLREILNRTSVIKLKIQSLKRALDSSREEFKQKEDRVDEARKDLDKVEAEKASIVEKINQKNMEKVELESRWRYLKNRLNEFPEQLKKSVRESQKSKEELKLRIEKIRKKVFSYDDVNFSAEEEYNHHKERYDYLQGQVDDLKEAGANLLNIIKEMDASSLKALEQTLDLLNQRFLHLFKKVFGGGTASIYFTDPSNKLESGVEVSVKLPGKRTTNLNLLSTGEKSLTAVTFLFALLSIKPGPFVILDELDAPLDEANVEKIANLIREFSENSQFLVVTHNKKTMEYADTMMGITMEEPGVSKVVKVSFEQIDEFAGEAADGK